MKEYFQLQLKMTNRKLTEFGLPPIWVYTLLPILFLGFSVYLFSKTEFAGYIFILIVLGLLSRLTDKKRNDFLKSCFTEKDYRKLRVLENLTIVLPFALVLTFQKSIAFIFILLVLVAILAFVDVNKNIKFTIPTPFYKKPFEFAVGFRNTFFIFPIAYSLAYISISVNNFNLGIFSILLIFLVSLSYYSKLENEYYIWSYNLSPKCFLLEKVGTGFFYITLSSIPILIPLAVYFSSQLVILLTFLILGYAYLVTIIFAKYSAYPKEMNIPQGVLIAISLTFPPMLIGIIPYFYLQSNKRLKAILQ